MMFPLLLVVVYLTTSSFGGTLCPPRENIYPCSCANIHQSKKLIHTIVNCHRLRDSDVLKTIFPTLRTMQIDQFHLYDSFWEAQKLGNAGEDKKVLPTDWLTLLKIKEVEIVDSAMTSCFACEWKLTCKNTVTTRFTSINSTSSDRICSLCNTGKGASKFPWTGCMTKLKHFHFSHGRLTTVGADLFPVAMKELTILNLTHNQIATVETNAFKNLPRLTMLDLSHNAIENIEYINFKTGLAYLDLSWNNIKTIGDKLFTYAGYLETLRLEYNDIRELKENEWKNANSETLKLIDLSENPVHCDCGMKWLNGTFKVHVTIGGICATPEEYENSKIRTASRLLKERCDSDGNIGTRQRSTTKSIKIIRKNKPSKYRLVL